MARSDVSSWSICTPHITPEPLCLPPLAMPATTGLKGVFFAFWAKKTTNYMISYFTVQHILPPRSNEVLSSGLWFGHVKPVFLLKARLSSNLVWKEGMTGKVFFDIYTTYLHVCLSFIFFYKFPFDRLATKLPFFWNNSQWSTLTVEHFQTAVFYWDLQVFLLNSLAKLTTLHKWTKKKNKRGNHRYSQVCTTSQGASGTNNGENWVTYNELTDL